MLHTFGGLEPAGAQPTAQTIAQSDPPPSPTLPAIDATGAETVTSAGVSEAVPSTSLLPHDLSVVGMFLAADIAVKVIMSVLMLSSLLTWTVAIAKGAELSGARRLMRRQLTVLTQALTLAEPAFKKDGVYSASRLLAAARHEMTASAGLPPGDSLKQRISARLDRIEVRAGRAMQRGTGVLATVGATAPFVGLLGTVWGIMNSFIGISKLHTTNLAVVAPGIAEALLATALGLLAAIPAVVIYNAISRSIAATRALYADAAAEVLCLASRDLDRPRAALPPLHSEGTSR